MRLKFMNIVDWIKENIRNGTFEAGERLPTEEEMSDQFSCSRYTVRQALTNLEKDGLIVATQEGATVSDKYDEFMANLSKRLDEIISRVDAMREKIAKS